MVEWGSELTLKLLDEYENHPLLWDDKAVGYSDRVQRREAWEEIAMNLEIDDYGMAEKKMKSLRTHFLAVRKAYLKKKDKYESATREIPAPKWYAYNAMLFLCRVFDARTPKESSRRKCEETEDDAEAEDENVQESEQEDAFQEDASFQDDSEYVPIPVKKRKRKHSIAEQMEKIHSRKKDFIATTRDDFTILGEHVAARLRKIHSPGIALEIQHRINNILFEGEIKDYKLKQSSKSSSYMPNFSTPERTLQSRQSSASPTNSIGSSPPSPRAQQNGTANSISQKKPRKVVSDFSASDAYSDPLYYSTSKCDFIQKQEKH